MTPDIARRARRRHPPAVGYGHRSLPPGGGSLNLALGCRARQSSLLLPSRHASVEEDAAGLLSGLITGGFQSHTAFERDPWWDVDLGVGTGIDEVRLFDRLDLASADRANAFALLVSDDGEQWRLVLEHEAAKPFGGLDGRPFVWHPPAGVRLTTRFLRVQARGLTYLHLDQVEVYGERGEPRGDDPR